MAATIREIAQRLNLSHTTVSRVLNNRNNAFISDETRERVLKAAREMRYMPNLAARSLRDSKTNIIGVFCSPRIQLDSGLIPAIIAGIRSVILARQLDMFFAFSPEEETSALPAWRFDGAIILQSPTAGTLRHLTELNQPFVGVNEKISGIPCILCDDTSGVRRALDHFYEAGHRKMAYANAEAWHFDHYSVTERQEAYLAWMRDHGLEPIPGHEDRLGSPDRTEFLRTAVQEHGATAILAYDHIVAIDVLASANRLGLRIPSDVSLIGFNDEFPVSRLSPALTVVAPERFEMGRLGAELLLSRLADPEFESPEITRVSEELIVRESVTVPRAA